MTKKTIYVADNDFRLDLGIGSPEITSRHDPFECKFVSLSDIIALEEKGSLPVKMVDTEDVGAVNKAIDSLPSMEREFMRLFYFQGFSIEDIALRSGIHRSRLYYIKRKASRRFKENFERLLGKKVESIFRNCPICSSKVCPDVDKFVLKWLEDNNWYFKGLMKALKTEFGLTFPSMKVIISHIKFHMNVDKVEIFKKLSLKYRRSDKIVDDEGEGPHVSLNISVSLSTKMEVEKLATDHGRTISEVARLLIRTSLKTVKMVLEAQDELLDAATKISRDFYKLRSLRNFDEM